MRRHSCFVASIEAAVDGLKREAGADARAQGIGWRQAGSGLQQASKQAVRKKKRDERARLTAGPGRCVIW